MFLPLCFLAAALCRVQTLATGLATNLPTGAQVELRGNQFIDCERGVELGARPVAGTVAPVLYSTCNTFQRDAQRHGTAFGFFLQNPPGSSLPLVFDDFTRPGQGVVLKDLFDPSGRAPGEYWAFWNQSGNAVSYRTFTEQLYNNRPANDYPTFSGGASNVTFIDGGSLLTTQTSPPDENHYVCSLVGYPDTGIQLRGAAPTPPSADTRLDQNIPNPCSGATTIMFKLPPKAQHGTLTVRRGLDGLEVMQVPLKGQATYHTLDVRALPAGLYFYTLLADGVPVQTRRMLIQ